LVLHFGAVILVWARCSNLMTNNGKARIAVDQKELNAQRLITLAGHYQAATRLAITPPITPHSPDNWYYGNIKMHNNHN
jgi:hypothetical protein